MKKVCIVRQGVYPMDVRVRKEATALIENGFKVDIICLRNTGEEKEEILKGVNVYRLPLQRSRGSITSYVFEYLSFFCCASLKLIILHFRNRYDCIQVNTLPDFLVFCTLIPKLLGAKIILDMHEPTHELFCTLFGYNNKFLMRAIKFCEQVSIRYADRAITVSDEMKNNYVTRGAKPSKISVVLNVPPLEFHHTSTKDNSQSTDPNKFMLVCHGAMIERYGQDTAIKAIPFLKEKIPGIQLNISGYGEHEYELKKLAGQLNLNDYVHFLGLLPFNELLKMLSNADIGIVPVQKNDYSDLVHTNKMFEFIALKKPVIISRTKAVEGFFGSDDTFLKYFKSGDEKDFARCVIELYNSPQTRAKMVENAFAKFQSVRWEVTKNDYCHLFQELIKGNC